MEGGSEDKGDNDLRLLCSHAVMRSGKLVYKKKQKDLATARPQDSKTISLITSAYYL